MAILESTDIPHPAIEALFTIDEETGMTGALELKGGMLSGSIMLNLDTEDDRELTIGCAGGIDINSTGEYDTHEVGDGYNCYKLMVKGLTGGHSGMDIHLGRGNANKLMNRILYVLGKTSDLRISEIDGGGLRNAIPRESRAVIYVHEKTVAAFEEGLIALGEKIIAEFTTTDPELEIVLEPFEAKGA